jgi:hypothetical protein
LNIGSWLARSRDEDNGNEMSFIIILEQFKKPGSPAVTCSRKAVKHITIFITLHLQNAYGSYFDYTKLLIVPL